MLQPEFAQRYKAIGPHQLDEVAARYGLSAEQTAAVRLHSLVLPFRTNSYVLEQLIDWTNVPADPIYQMVFPQPGMLAAPHERRLQTLWHSGDKKALNEYVGEVRRMMNPHPSGQKELNVPIDDGHAIAGTQHKYDETVLYFPAQGQTCHAYCTYCFRWAQFVGDQDLKFAAHDPIELVAYLAQHPEVTDVLITGGDPLIMTTERLRAHIEPLLAVETVRTIRIGSKALAYWPYRFTTDNDADDLLRLFGEVVASGRNLALMSHFTHPREMSTSEVATAIERIKATGAVIYCQAPIMRRINDDPQVWNDMWSNQVRLGVIPYYMFVARDTGPHEYFEVSLGRAHEVFTEAYRHLPGLARGVRGPVMSATPGKVVIDGIAEHANERLFALRFLQARDPELVGRPFFAKYDANAVWLDDLVLAPGTPADIRAAIHPGLGRVSRVGS